MAGVAEGEAGDRGREARSLRLKICGGFAIVGCAGWAEPGAGGCFGAPAEKPICSEELKR